MRPMIRSITSRWLAPVLACLALSFAASARAEIPGSIPPLTLDEAWRLTQAQHPDFRAAAAEREAASALARQAGAWPNPELSAQVEDTRPETRTSTLLWSQPLALFGQQAARVDAAQWAQRQAEGAALARRAQLRSRLNLAFFAALAAQERLTLAGELGQLASHARQVAARRVAAGKAPPLEEVKAQVAEVQAASALRLAQGAWRVAWQNLQHALGGLLPAAGQVQGDLSLLPDPACWQGAATQIAGTSAVQQAELAWGHQRALAEVERTRARPDITLQLGVKRDAQWGRNQPVMGIVLPLPLWDRNEGAITAALKQADRAEADLQNTRASVHAQATEAFEQLQSTVEQALTLRETVLPAARQALDLAGKGYELGRFGILDVLDAQRTLFEVRQQALASAEQAFRAEARLIELFGDAPMAPRE